MEYVVYLLIRHKILSITTEQSPPIVTLTTLY